MGKTKWGECNDDDKLILEITVSEARELIHIIRNSQSSSFALKDIASSLIADLSRKESGASPIYRWDHEQN